MTVFSSTQPSLRARVLPRFPANVVAGAGMVITKSGTTYTFSTDIGDAPPLTFVSVATYGATGGDATADTAGFLGAFNTGAAAIWVPKTAQPYKLSWVLIPSTVKLIMGPGSISYGGANAFAHCLYTSDHPGPLKISTGFDVDRTTFSQVVCVGVYGNTSNIVLSECNATAAGRSLLLIDNDGIATHCGIEDSYISGFYQCAAFIFGGTGHFFRRNYVVAPNDTTGHILNFEPSPAALIYDPDISYNYFYGGGPSGSPSPGLGYFAVGMVNAIRAKIVGNTCVDQKGEAIHCDASGGGLTSSDCLVADNIIGFQNQSSFEIGLGMSADSGNTVRNLTVRGNKIYKAKFSGILLGGGVGTFQNCVVQSNYIVDCNQGNDAGGMGIQLFDVSQTIVRDNTLISTDGLMKWGVGEGHGSGTSPNTNKFYNNISVGHATAAYKLLGAASHVFDPTQTV